ncbi:TetR/AcrR family transcriptional regulator [Streptomyces sp. SID14515]|uniref:TetR/AcrR family transcriptional regulator n=1 Tax=Streptomyces sp. SID14515 TaxID=2706074 RepID=UPI0013C96C37|nr:TetR/AcrR family transcriptional regulator [Streptomyces sp. SID14515]NEB36440.1 TetR/AcrR family transcriptional regulator [Streptomyces sp. SID14515]
MSSVESRGSRAAAPRRRADKRQAILDAAFLVFARRGYAQACVQEVAEEAGVAKPTVYNHLDDKETLFRHAVEAAADVLLAELLAAIDDLRDRASEQDPRAALTDLAVRLARICCGERAIALRRLTYAEAPHFADLADAVQERTARRPLVALADRLARLALSGRLRPCDPEQAAGHFFALLTGPLELLSRLGARPVPAAELRSTAEGAVDVFLRAYVDVPGG